MQQFTKTDSLAEDGAAPPGVKDYLQQQQYTPVVKDNTYFNSRLVPNHLTYPTQGIIQWMNLKRHPQSTSAHWYDMQKESRK